MVFPDVHRKVRDADTRHVRVQRIRLYGEVLRDFVERWGLLARGVDMRVPRRLWTASHDEIAAYLQSVFQADGYVSTRRDTAARTRASRCGHQRTVDRRSPAAADGARDLLASHPQARSARRPPRSARGDHRHRLRARSLRRTRRLPRTPEVRQAAALADPAQLEALSRTSARRRSSRSSLRVSRRSTTSRRSPTSSSPTTSPSTTASSCPSRTTSSRSSTGTPRRARSSAVAPAPGSTSRRSADRRSRWPRAVPPRDR